MADNQVLEESRVYYGAIYMEPVKLHDYEKTPGSSSGSTIATSTCSIEGTDESTMTNMFDWVFLRVFGFDSNPLQQRSQNCRNSAAADLSLSMISNFSTAYNVISISLALRMMEASKLSPMPSDEELCSSALIAGMIVGQLTLGAMGDVLGRHRAMSFVLLLQVAGALLSACSCPVSNFCSVFDVLAFWRFILGLGCGGVYPLSATLTTESSSNNKDKAKLVALTFSFQGVGYLVLPIAAMVIVSILGESSTLSWRILLGLGCLPGTILMVYRQRPQTHTTQSTVASDDSLESVAILDQNLPPAPRARVVPVSIVDAILLEPNLIRKLAGTAGCWLLFDILFYGNTLFQPVVLQAAFGSSAESVFKGAHDTFWLALMALPGYYVTVAAVGRQSPRWIQIQGFLVMGVLYWCIGVFFDQLSKHCYSLLLVYGSTFFFSNYGPNATTFMLPSMTFDKSCRSTLNGISAAAGKVGALLGSTIFVASLRQWGEVPVFLCCSVLAFVGCFLTLFCVSREVGLEEEDCLPRDEGQETRHNKTVVPMKLVYSHPSLLDSNGFDSV